MPPITSGLFRPAPLRRSAVGAGAAGAGAALAALAVAAALAGRAALAGAEAGKEAAAAAGPPLREAIGPFLAGHCTECHGSEKRKGGIALDRLSEPPSLEERRLLQRVLAMLRAGKMPPRARPAPPREEVQATLAAIEKELARIDCSGAVDPGRVTIRRLNRAEYNNTIRDLLALDFQPADDFPSDDVGYGFDNIGDVLSLPPLLMEKYLAAAEKIVAKALVTEPVPLARLEKFDGDLLRVTGPMGPVSKKGQTLLPGAEIRAKPEIQEEGEYILRVKATGRKGGQGPARISLRVDGKEISLQDMKGIDGSSQTYEVRARLKPGTRRFQVAFLDSPAAGKEAKEKAGDKDKDGKAGKDGTAKKAAKTAAKPGATTPAKKPTRFLLVEHLSVDGPMDAKPRPLPESHVRLMVCDPLHKNREACARKVLEAFVRPAWRRPAAREEIDRLLRLVTPGLKAGDSLEKALQPALAAVLSSPYFIYKVELDRGAPGSISPLSEWELATRLSYFLWSSMPDEELFARAGDGTLRRPEVLEAQVRRMLRDRKARALVENFAGQWLTVRNLRGATPDPKLFPSFSERMREDMLRETEMFFQAILDEDRSVLEFIDSDFTFLNERLAKHYGLSDVKGEEFRRVKLSGPARGGVLTHASVLTVTSNPTRTSPVKRGKWILEQMLGTPPPPPPPGVDDLKESPEAVQASSLRERMEEHRRKADCAGCHGGMDPLGFGLENYDAVGAWREKDGKFPIDASGTLPGGETFRGPGELKTLLKQRQEDFLRNLTEKMLTFALGRGLEYHDACAVDAAVKAVKGDGCRLQRLILEVTRSVPFGYRRRPGAEKTEKEAGP